MSLHLYLQTFYNLEQKNYLLFSIFLDIWLKYGDVVFINKPDLMNSSIDVITHRECYLSDNKTKLNP